MRYLFLLALLFCLPVSPRAQTAQTQESPPAKTYIYEKPALPALAKLYWALGAFDLSDDAAIDNFIKITQCDLYRKYVINEFQWHDIREDMRKFLKENKDKFSVRFEIVQPLRLGQYDFKRGGFALAPGYEVRGASRYEIITEGAYDRVCEDTQNVPGYPKAMYAELSRPINLDFIPMEAEEARKLIEKKQKYLSKIGDVDGNISDYRDAYLVLKMNMFGYKGQARSNERQLDLARVLASLEVLEVYADEARTELLYKEDYLRRKTISSTEMKLRKEREAQRLKQMESEKTRQDAGDKPAQ